MHSRTIALTTAIALMLLIVAGSLALRHALGPAAAPEPAATPVLPPAAVLAATPAAGAAPILPPGETGGAGAADEKAVAADTLQWLLTRIHVLFKPYSAEINDEMIPYLADVITVVNQRDDLHYRLELFEPDAGLARQRAQTLNDVLRLNVVVPSSLSIAGREGSHGIRVDVTS